MSVDRDELDPACAENGHEFEVDDVDPDSGDPLYVTCRRCPWRWSCLAAE